MPVSARIVGDALVCAALALLDVPTQFSGSADLEGAHYARLLTMQGMRIIRGVATENVRHL
jgi:hypothetical protein